MITQQINISFTSAMAETIRIHTGESGRQIIFTPDFLEAIPNDHGADVIIVKPDNTFVIAAASIDTDGKIYVTIPEQAGAVSGVGNYILKVYDNDNLCIYSACGGFYIDDHLLMDEMLESIAEVYGYQFPQDFALKDEAAPIDDDVIASDSTWSSSKIADEISSASPDLIDDEEMLYDKTWSSEKISYELGQITGLDVYSTAETVVGKWTDGKPIYQKTLISPIPSSTGWQNIAVGIENLKEMISLTGMLNQPYQAIPFGWYGSASSYFNGYYVKNSTPTRIDYHHSYSNATSIYFTIRYTKTTD